MRILTGKHRAAYESLVAQNARLMAEVKRLEDELLAWRCEISEWKERYDGEKRRADLAVDAQLTVRGFPPVTPRDGMPTMPDELAEDPEAVERMEQRLAAGDATVFLERL